jgi:hypothetical protein
LQAASKLFDSSEQVFEPCRVMFRELKESKAASIAVFLQRKGNNKK